MLHPHVPDPWYRRETLYQIYPLSWADSNGDGYGDLRGILEHLDYLNDGTAASLGAGAIWLSPIYQSPMADWGYDIADHCAIDPRFGTMADFDDLLAAAHKRGMKVLLDYVPNHTSVEHAWFQEARRSRQSPRRDWYIWADPGPDDGPPNNWLSRFGGSAWTLDETTGQYYLHTFLAEQPDLNWRNPAVRDAMLKVLRFWLRRGVDGFRTDAVSSLLKDEQLRDDPPNPDYRPGISSPADANLRLHSSASGHVSELLGSFCEVVAQSPDGFLLSEVYANLPQLQALYGACRQHPVHAPFNFNLLALEWSARSYQSFLDEYEASLGPDDWPNYVLGNHDRPRLVERVGEKRARLLTFLQFTLRGLPIIYNGDELGLHNVVKETTKSLDSAAEVLTVADFDRDSARAPMPWTSQPEGYGFTSGKPWLPAAPDSLIHNVAVEERDPDSMLHLYRHLMHMRRSLAALTHGTYRSLNSGNPAVLAFVRETETMNCYILINFAETPQTVKLGAIGRWIASTHQVEGDGEIHTGGLIELEPFEGRLYERRQRRN